MNVSSPFGLNARELFLNIRYRGIVSNKLSNMLYLTDLDGHLVNVEGSPIFCKRSHEVVAIRLPSVHSFNLFMGASLIVPIDVVLEAISNTPRKFEPIQPNGDGDFSEAVVRIRDGHLR